MKFWQLSGGENAGGKAELRIYGDIGDWWDGNTDKEFAAALDAVQASELDVYINSYGGDAVQGLAMHYALNRFKARGILRTHNDGIVASAAVAPFLAADKENRFAPDGCVLMIHNALSSARGEAKDLRAAADGLDAVSTSAADLYAKCTGNDVTLIKQWMDATTYMTAEQQVDNGFATASPSSAKSIEASMQGAVLMCGGQAVTMQKLPGMPAAVLATMLASSKPNQQQAQVNQGHAATNKEAEKVVQHAGAAGSPQGEDPKMDQETLKAQHGDVHAAVMQAGAQAERQRIAAIRQHCPAGFEQMADKAIDEGKTPEAFAMSVLAAQKEQGAQFLQQRKEDANADGGANGAPNAQPAADDAEKAKMAQAEIIKMAAGSFKQSAGVIG